MRRDKRGKKVIFDSAHHINNRKTSRKLYFINLTPFVALVWYAWTKARSLHLIHIGGLQERRLRLPLGRSSRASNLNSNPEAPKSGQEDGRHAWAFPKLCQFLTEPHRYPHPLSGHRGWSKRSFVAGDSLNNVTRVFRSSLQRRFHTRARVFAYVRGKLARLLGTYYNARPHGQLTRAYGVTTQHLTRKNGAANVSRSNTCSTICISEHTAHYRPT